MALLHENEVKALEKPHKKEWHDYRTRLSSQTKSSLKTFTKEFKEIKKRQKLEIKHAEGQLKKTLENKYQQSNKDLYIQFLDSQKKSALSQERDLSRKQRNEKQALERSQKEEIFTLLVQCYRDQIKQLEEDSKQRHKFLQQLYILLNQCLQKQKQEKLDLFQEYEVALQSQSLTDFENQKSLIEHEHAKTLETFQKECQHEDQATLKNYRKSLRKSKSTKPETSFEEETSKITIQREKWKREQELETMKTLHHTELKFFQKKKKILEILFEEHLSLIRQTNNSKRELEENLFILFWNQLEEIPNITLELVSKYRSILSNIKLYAPPPDNVRQRVLENQHEQYQKKMNEEFRKDEAMIKKKYGQEISKIDQEIQLLISQFKEREKAFLVESKRMLAETQISHPEETQTNGETKT